MQTTSFTVDSCLKNTFINSTFEGDIFSNKMEANTGKKHIFTLKKNI